MAKKQPHPIAIRLTDEEIKALTIIAAQTDSIAATSIHAGKPSWRTLIKRIANGELEVVKKPER